MKKSKHKKKVLDDIEELPEELEEDFSEGVEDPDEEELEEDTTEEIMVDDFHRFKESVPSDWEG